MSQPAIQIRNLAKKFRLYDTPGQRLREALHPFRRTLHREFWALRDVSFDVEKGATLGILGRNGSGKSTLLKIIAGVMQPTHGEALAHGRVAALLELGAGFNPDLTGRQNATLQLQIANETPDRIATKLEEIEQFADIGSFFDQPVRVYSSGMFVRVAFAAAISVEPDILIIDEALAVGDAKFREKCYRRLNNLREDGTTLVIVTHDVATITRLCDRCIVLNDSHLIFDGDARMAVNAYENILFGTKEPNTAQNPAATPAINIDTQDRRIRYMSNPAFNPAHSRLGDDRAGLIDFRLSVDGKIDRPSLRSGSTLEIHASYLFDKHIPNLAFGVGITTVEGVMIFGTNTTLMGLPGVTAAAQQVVSWRARITPHLTAGQYCLNFGVTEIDQAGPAFVDVRRAIVLLDVDAPRHANGLAVFDCEIIEIWNG